MIRINVTHCNTLQHTATHCNTLQHAATHRNTLQHTATHRNTLQHTATHRNTPQHTATFCNPLQHTATGHHLFWDVESCKEMLVAAEIRDVEWATWTCVMGWPAQGIAPKFQGPLGINSTARSSFGDTLASADDWGMVSVCVAVCCSVLQRVAVCSTARSSFGDTLASADDWGMVRGLQCGAVCCSVLKCGAVCCSVLQCVAVCWCVMRCVAVCWRHVGVSR